MKMMERVRPAVLVPMRLPSHETSIPMDTQASFLQSDRTNHKGVDRSRTRHEKNDRSRKRSRLNNIRPPPPVGLLLLADEGEQARAKNQHDADEHRPVQVVVEDQVAEEDRPEHLTVLRRRDTRGRRV